MNKKLLLLPLLLTSCSVNTTTHNDIISKELNDNIFYIYNKLHNINREIVSATIQLHYYYINGHIQEYTYNLAYRQYTYNVFATTYDCYITYLAKLYYDIEINDLYCIDIYEVSKYFY